MVDGRWNMVDESGTQFYVTDMEQERRVAGPFGSAEYAGRVMDRMTSEDKSSPWPNPDALRVEQFAETASMQHSGEGQ